MSAWLRGPERDTPSLTGDEIKPVIAKTDIRHTRNKPWRSVICCFDKQKHWPKESMNKAAWGSGQKTEVDVGALGGLGGELFGVGFDKLRELPAEKEGSRVNGSETDRLEGDDVEVKLKDDIIK